MGVRFAGINCNRNPINQNISKFQIRLWMNLNQYMAGHTLNSLSQEIEHAISEYSRHVGWVQAIRNGAPTCGSNRSTGCANPYFVGYLRRTNNEGGLLTRPKAE